MRPRNRCSRSYLIEKFQNDFLFLTTAQAPTCRAMNASPLLLKKYRTRYKKTNPIWSGKRGLNSRPSAWQADALPTELLPHILQIFPTLFSTTPNCLISRSGTLHVSLARSNGAGSRIRTEAGKADGLQDRSNRPLWESSIFC